MRPLTEMPPATRRGIAGILTDIDDTLSSEGRLTAAAYGALERLHVAGLTVIAVTGRPAGWCDHIARFWPVDALVGENGAFWMRYDQDSKRLQTVYAISPPADRQGRIEAIAREILAAVPGTALASDQFCRISDLAIDYCEDVPTLPRAAVDEIVRIMEARGMKAKVSSIHVNGWFGDFDKLSTTRLLLAEVWGLSLDDPNERERWVFVGDSPNDAPMFAFFPNAIGVANVRDFVGRLASPPAYITQARAGAGFVELAELLLAGRVAS